MTTRGSVTPDDLDAMWGEALADSRWSKGLRVLIDHMGADRKLLTAVEVERRAMTVRERAEEIGCQKIAVVVPEGFDLWLFEALVLDGEVGFRARGFSSLGEARQWLALPLEESPTDVAPRPSG